jgi:protein-disulfide isomerase
MNFIKSIQVARIIVSISFINFTISALSRASTLDTVNDSKNQNHIIADVLKAIAVEDRPVLGDKDSPVTVLEISSFKCTHCHSFHDNVFPAILDQYIKKGKIRWIILNASDYQADQYSKIFSIAKCIQRQGKYWDVLQNLFINANKPPSFLEDLIGRLPQVNSDDLGICLTDRSIRNSIALDFTKYQELKVHGTPTFFVWRTDSKGKVTETTVAGAQTLTYFQQVFDTLLRMP